MFEKFFPDRYVASTYVIDFEKLYKNGIRGLIFDIDNTLVPHGAPADERAIRLFKRLKEIGLRRVNGAKVRDVLNMLIWGFLKWVILAFAIAVPITWYLINRWLATYPYHISQQVWVYLGVGVTACLIAILMVGGQSYRAASLNPVKT